MFWLTDALLYLDIDLDNYIRESFLIMHYSKGGITKKELAEMSFKIFEKYLRIALEIQTEMNKDTSEQKYLRGN